MSIDARVMSIADAALAGTAPTRDDVLYLLQFDGYSVEAAYVNTRARELTFRACDGTGLVYAQIGVDALPCPENCRFCTFAAVNADAVKGYGDAAAAEVPLERIVELAKTFDEAGVHLISLMATAGLSFNRYVTMVKAVREAVSPDMPILVNTADITLEQALILKEAGAQAAYHARRIYEGELTDIDPAQRYETIRNLNAAGLALMTGVEPLYEAVSLEELADRIMEVPSFNAYSTGSCALSAAADTEMEDETPSPRAKVRYVASILRLVVGTDVPFGCSGGATWVDAGTDPRGRHYGHEAAWLKNLVHRARRDLEKDGWTVPARPNGEFFANWHK